MSIKLRAYEWEKHGTCSLGLLDIKEEFDYFSKSLELREKFDFGRILEKSGIVPDDHKLYTIENIMSAVKLQLGVLPIPLCTKKKKLKKQYLREMQICFDKKMDLIECHNTRPMCSSKLPVSYPTIKPKVA